MLQSLCDTAFALWPQPLPTREQVAKAKIIAHRGLTGLSGDRENSLTSFRRCRDAGVWGVELDVRWSQDNIPFVLHDEEPNRIYPKTKIKPSQENFSTLKKLCPDIPSLEQVLDNCAGRTHLMIELKEPLDSERQERLKSLLDGFEACTDYHLLSLQPSFFRDLGGFPREALILVALTNTRQISQEVLNQGYGGIAGHYVLINRRILKLHQQRGHKVGVGFVASQNNLYRELMRGIEWIFTNRAVVLQSYLD